MQHYFVSYRITPTTGTGWMRQQRREDAVHPTDDLADVVMRIIPTRRRSGIGKLKAHLKEYREHGRITFGTQGNAGVIRDLVIKKLPLRHKNILDEYL